MRRQRNRLKLACRFAWAALVRGGGYAGASWDLDIVPVRHGYMCQSTGTWTEASPYRLRSRCRTGVSSAVAAGVGGPLLDARRAGDSSGCGGMPPSPGPS
jgi:hypothetical protein